MKKINELIKFGINFLSSYNIENPRKETEILLSKILNKPIISLYTENMEISQKHVEKFLRFLNLRVRKIPIQYLIQEVYFYGLKFKIKKGVFIPRPETEILVEKTIEIYNNFFYPQKVKILDIGTGSGNIGICLAKNIENCSVVGTDISKKAIKLAMENAILNEVEKKIKFLKTPLFPENLKFEIIVSNPPYVKETDYKNLDEEVKKEPKISLIAGKDGLKYIKKIIQNARKFLKRSGFLLIEIGYDHSKILKEMDFSEFYLNLVEFVKDLNGIERVAVFRKE